MKKIVLVVTLAFGTLVISCKKEKASTEEQITNEQITPEVVDSIKTDTIAPYGWTKRFDKQVINCYSL